MVQLDDVRSGAARYAARQAGGSRARAAVALAGRAVRRQGLVLPGQARAARSGGRRPRRLERKPIVAGGRRLAASQRSALCERRRRRAAAAGGQGAEPAGGRPLSPTCLVIPAGETLQLSGRRCRGPTRRLGFVRGRELREGCVIARRRRRPLPAQQRAHDAALTAGCAIVERHAHSRRLPGSDGRARPRRHDLLELASTCGFGAGGLPARGLARSRPADGGAARARAGGRGVRPGGARGALARRRGRGRDRQLRQLRHDRSASATSPAPARLPAAGAAWLVDAWWPEYDAYLRASAPDLQDWLFTPLDSLRLGIGPYRWNSAGFAAVRQAPWLVAARSWRSRRLARQGAARQRALLEMDEALARHYARQPAVRRDPSGGQPDPAAVPVARSARSAAAASTC